MGEKRYFKIEYDEEWYLFDSTTISEQLVDEQAEYGYGVFANSLSPSEVVDLLNEQQSAITKLKELNDDKGKMIISLIRTNKTLKEENEQLKQYKLYEDNKRLQTIIADLKEENEQLRKELDNFKPVMFQDMRKGTIILYSKGD